MQNPKITQCAIDRALAICNGRLPADAESVMLALLVKALWEELERLRTHRFYKNSQI